MLEEVRPIGIRCTGMPSLRGLTEGEIGSGPSPIRVSHAGGDVRWDVCVPWSRRLCCYEFPADKDA